MGSIIGHRIDYNGVGALRGQRHIPSKNLPKSQPRLKALFPGFGGGVGNFQPHLKDREKRPGDEVA